jgi:hypothetical protein
MDINKKGPPIFGEPLLRTGRESISEIQYIENEAYNRWGFNPSSTNPAFFKNLTCLDMTLQR